MNELGKGLKDMEWIGTSQEYQQYELTSTFGGFQRLKCQLKHGLDQTSPHPITYVADIQLGLCDGLYMLGPANGSIRKCVE